MAGAQEMFDSRVKGTFFLLHKCELFGHKLNKMCILRERVK